LQREGYEVIVAGNGNEGIAAFLEQKPDIIITDIIMPENDGVDVIKKIRDQVSDVKIIAISGGGKQDPQYQPESISTTVYLAAADSAGADLTITKPFKKEQLLNSIEKLL
jgi:CheY-like chemotaxis protein